MKYFDRDDKLSENCKLKNQDFFIMRLLQYEVEIFFNFSNFSQNQIYGLDQ